MYQLFIRGASRILGSARALQKPGSAAVTETVENSDPIFERLRDEARRHLQRQRERPKSDEAELEMVRDLRRRRVRQEHPDLDETAVGEIVDNVAQVYQLIGDICRRRLRQEGAGGDEVEVQMRLMLIAHPPTRLVEDALVQRMHLPAEERLQQVAEMMVDKVLGS